MTSMDGLKRRIAAGKYTVDPHEVAGAIVDKLALIKRARHHMEAEDDEAARSPKRRGRRGAGRAEPRRAGQRSPQTRGE